MARTFYDVTAKGGSYKDRDGKEKHRYLPAGKLCVEDDGRMWIALEWPGVNMILSVFEQRPKDGQGGGGSSSGASGAKANISTGNARNDIDDDIPF